MRPADVFLYLSGIVSIGLIILTLINSWLPMSFEIKDGVVFPFVAFGLVIALFVIGTILAILEKEEKKKE